MKKLISTFLLITLLLGALAGCQKTTLKGDDKGSILTAYMFKYPVSLDPAIAQSDSDVNQLFGLIYEGLTVLNGDGSVSGGLATSWRSYQDRITKENKLEFKLRESRWSDQREISADDIIYAWKRILDPSFESPYASLLFPIKNAKKCKSGEMTSDDVGLVADSPKTLTVTFEDDFGTDLFTEIVASPGLVALPEDVMKRNPKTWSNTAADMAFNGPFKIVSMEKDYRIILERNTYYNRESDETDKDIKKFLDKNVLPYRIVCYYGNYDKTGALSIADISARYGTDELMFISSFTKDTYANFSTSSKNSLSGFTYYFNTNNEVLSDPKVRTALSVALDRNYIATEIVGKGVEPATGFVPSGVFNTGKGSDFRSKGGDLYSTSADTAKAQALLSEAGVSSGSFTIAYVDIEGDDTQKRIAEYARDTWNKLGFTVEIKAVRQTYFSKVISTAPTKDADGFDVIGIDCMARCTDAFAYLAPFARQYSGSYVDIKDDKGYTPHFTGFENDDYDKLVDETVNIYDRSVRAENLHKLEEMLVSYCPATTLYFNNVSYSASGSVKKFNVEYFGVMCFDKMELKGYKSSNEVITAKIREGEDAAALAAASKND